MKPNLSLQLQGVQTLTITEAPIRHIGPGEALVQVRATGLCGSDIHLWKHGSLGPVPMREGQILGHEGAGEVLEVHDDVKSLQPGDRVAIEPLHTCGSCLACSSGRGNLCDQSAFCGIYGPPGPSDGTCQRYMVHPVKLLHRLPTDMTFQQGALLEPLSVSLQAVRNANVQLGSPALVCGAGPIGLLALTCLRAAGAWPIVVTDIDRTRLKTAEEVVTGVGTHWVNTAEQPSAVASEVRKLFAQLNRSGAGTDKADKGETVAPVAVIECTGISSSITTACHAVRKAGTVMVVGAGESSVDNFPAAVIMSKEVRSPNLR